jgi:hypothetical protein
MYIKSAKYTHIATNFLKFAKHPNPQLQNITKAIKD